VRSFIIGTYLRIALAYQIKTNEVGRACGNCGRGEDSVQGFGGKAQRIQTTWKTKA
jgi:hypothetical protein